MHKIGVTHRDLKPQNITIDYDGKIKIIDFGLGNIYKKSKSYQYIDQKLETEKKRSHSYNRINMGNGQDLLTKYY